jgi:hypothetical protein
LGHVPRLPHFPSFSCLIELLSSLK